MYSFPDFEPVHCSMFGSNCCFLTCIQISQEAGQVVWYSHLLKNFPQFVVIHTVQGFAILNKAELDGKGSQNQLMRNLWHLAYLVKVKVKSLSRAWLFATPWIVACTKLLCPWDFQGKNTGVGCHFLLQGTFLTQGSNPGLSHSRQTLYHLSHQGSPLE